MADLLVNVVDIMVAVVLLVSALLAFSRGAVREIMGIGAWIGAALAAYFGFTYARPFARELIPQSDAAADAAAAAVPFLVALIVLTIVNQIIAGRIQRSRLGALDRTLGLIFGLLRGAVLICLAYMLFIYTVKEPDRPEWVAEARTLPFIEQGAAAIRKLVPQDLQEKADEQATQAMDDVRKLQEAEEAIRALTEPIPATTSEGDDSGYGNRERKQLDGLTETVDE